MKNLNLKVELSIPNESIEEVLVTAIEGGINYWGFISGEEKLEQWLDQKIKSGELERDESIHYKWMDAMFNEIKYTDNEMTSHQADLEAQDYDVFGENKI